MTCSVAEQVSKALLTSQYPWRGNQMVQETGNDENMEQLRQQKFVRVRQ